MDIYDVEALLYVQEALFDKYRKELASLKNTTNVAQGLLKSEVTKHVAPNANGHHFYRGRGRNTHGRGRGRQTYTISNNPTCQLCNMYDHYVLEYRQSFDESFGPAYHKSQPQGSVGNDSFGTQNAKTQETPASQGTTYLAHQNSLSIL